MLGCGRVLGRGAVRQRRGRRRASSRGVDGLVRVYDAILDARFDQVGGRAAAGVRPPAPREACDVLAATATWWRILLDPDSRALDHAVRRAKSSGRSAPRKPGPRASRRTPRRTSTPAPPTPRASSGACCATRSSPRRATASASSRRSNAPSRSTRTSTTRISGSGSTGTYADVAPAAAKVLRFLLMLPGGDKTEGHGADAAGARAGQAAAGRGGLPAADPLSLVRAARRPRASTCSSRCSDRYPGNPLFPAQLADVQDRYQHDITASLATWRALLAAAREQRVNEAGARRGAGAAGHRAPARGAVTRPTSRSSSCARCSTPRPAKPAGAMAAAYLALGEGEDRLGHHDAAVAAYRLAIAAAPGPRPAGDPRSAPPIG